MYLPCDFCAKIVRIGSINRETIAALAAGEMPRLLKEPSKYLPDTDPFVYQAVSKYTYIYFQLT